MILAGDVGGTKTILALFDGDTEIYKRHTPSADYATFDELLVAFLADAGCKTITAACLGVAGPIVNGDCVATNLPWTLNHKTIGQQIGTARVWLLNDLAATAWGLLNLPPQHFVELNAAAQWQQGHNAVIAAGTGLGEAIIAWNGESHCVIASEGGHCDFAPTNEQEIALLRYLQSKYPEHVSYERVVSGEGLVNIYAFLKQTGYAPEHRDIAQRLNDEDAATVIGQVGVVGSDALCAEALRLFCKIYGAEAGNLALKCLPTAGVYVAGGIAAKILPVLAAGEFMRGFLAKGRSRSVLQHTSVRVCMNPEVALLGAVAYGRKLV